MDESKISQICKALGDENRLKIISLLTKGELCACHILEQFKITQPTLSHHMKILSDCQLVKSRKDGKWTYYEINCCVFKEFKQYFENIQCWKDLKKSDSNSDTEKNSYGCNCNTNHS